MIQVESTAAGVRKVQLSAQSLRGTFKVREITDLWKVVFLLQNEKKM